MTWVAKFKIENAATLIIAIPVRDPRTDTDVWVETEFGIWLDVIESRADGAWKLDYKGSKQLTGQVRTKVPLQGRSSAANTAVALIIVNAKAGQQARRHDSNPLNLRRDNLFLLGDPGTAEGKAGNAKTDTRALFRTHGDAREALAGQDYGVPLEC